MWLTIMLGLPVGLAFGFAAQRGRFCLNSAFRDLLLLRDATLFRAYALAVLVQMVGVQLLLRAGLVKVFPLPFFWVANLVGGLAFGAGMVLAGACSGGSWYKSGEGYLASLAAVVGFAVTAAMTEVGPLSPLRQALQAFRLLDRTGNPRVTIATALGLPSPWLVIVPVALLAGYWLLRSSRRAAFAGWDWSRTGAAIGAIGVVAVAASWATGRPLGLGITTSTSHWLRWLLHPDGTLLSWESFFVLGIPLGAFAAARRAGEFHWRYPGGRQLAAALAGGALMGSSAMVMGGCTIGHALAGVPLLSLSSITSTLAIVAGAGFAAWLRFGRVSASPAHEIRSVGEICPFPLVRAQQAVAALATGDRLRITFDCAQALESLPRWAERAGHSVLERRQVEPGVWQIVIAK